MWRPERNGRHVLRLGTLRAELWRNNGALLDLHDSVDLHHVNRPLLLKHQGGQDMGDVKQRLTRAIEPLLSKAQEDRLSHLDIIVESGWLPVTLVDCGTQLWNGDQIVVLAKHRLGTLYGAAVQDWTIRTSYVMGDAKALVFGLPNAVHEALIRACAELGLIRVSIQPALAWGLNRLRGALGGKQLRWWLWTEQDRGILGRSELGNVSALNAAAAIPTNQDQVQIMLESERKRQGHDHDDSPVTVCLWRAAPPLTYSAEPLALVRWHFLASDPRQLHSHAAVQRPNSAPVASREQAS